MTDARLHSDHSTFNSKSKVAVTLANSDYCRQAHAWPGSLCFGHIADSPVFHLLVTTVVLVVFLVGLLKNCDWKLGLQVFRLRLLCNFDIC